MNNPEKKLVQLLTVPKLYLIPNYFTVTTTSKGLLAKWYIHPP